MFKKKKYQIKFIDKNHPYKGKSWEWCLRSVPDSTWQYANYNEARRELKRARKESPEYEFRLVQVLETHTFLKV